jgi:hypothetical protein
MKHHTRWQILQNGDDTLTATSPAGYVYTIRPEGRMRPAPKQLHTTIKTTTTVTATTTTSTAPEREVLAGCPF